MSPSPTLYKEFYLETQMAESLWGSILGLWWCRIPMTCGERQKREVRCLGGGAAYKRTELYSWGKWKNRNGRNGEQGKAKNSHGYPQDSLGKGFRSPGAGELSWESEEGGKVIFKKFLLGAMNWAPLTSFFFFFPQEILFNIKIL